jgi:hypothetical protein
MRAESSCAGKDKDAPICKEGRRMRTRMTQASNIVDCSGRKKGREEKVEIEEDGARRGSGGIREPEGRRTSIPFERVFLRNCKSKAKRANYVLERSEYTKKPLAMRISSQSLETTSSSTERKETNEQRKGERPRNPTGLDCLFQNIDRLAKFQRI